MLGKHGTLDSPCWSEGDTSRGRELKEVRQGGLQLSGERASARPWGRCVLCVLGGGEGPCAWSRVNKDRREVGHGHSVATGGQSMDFVSTYKDLGLYFQGDGNLLKGLNQGSDRKSLLYLKEHCGKMCEKIDCGGQSRSREAGGKAIAETKANQGWPGRSDSGRDSEK